MKIILKQSISWVILLLFSSNALAAEGHFYLGGSIGASRAELEDSNPEINYYYGYLNDAYPLDASHETAAIYGITGGYEFLGRGLMPAIALGLGLYTTEKYDFTGQLVETALGGSPSTLYDYEFDLRSQRIMAEAQFTWSLFNLAPFVNVGVGSAWNRLSGYTESPVDSTGYVPLPGFQSHTDNNLAYQLGLGVGYGFNFLKDTKDFQHERILLGYRYANLGDASFETRGINYPYKIGFDNVTTNELYFTYMHLF
jgi:opacity protein-like surface antigen